MTNYVVFTRKNIPNKHLFNDPNAFVFENLVYTFVGEGFNSIEDMFCYVFEKGFPYPIRMDLPNAILNKGINTVTNNDWFVVLSDINNKWTFVTFWDNDLFIKTPHPLWQAYLNYINR